MAIACAFVPSATDRFPLRTFLKIVLSAAAVVVIAVLLSWFGRRSAAASIASA
jgi:hypothetical protein